MAQRKKEISQTHGIQWKNNRRFSKNVKKNDYIFFRKKKAEPEIDVAIHKKI